MTTVRHESCRNQEHRERYKMEVLKLFFFPFEAVPHLERSRFDSGPAVSLFTSHFLDSFCKMGMMMMTLCFKKSISINYYNHFSYMKVLQLASLHDGNYFQSSLLVRLKKSTHLVWCTHSWTVSGAFPPSRTEEEPLLQDFYDNLACTACLAELEGISDIMRTLRMHFSSQLCEWRLQSGQEGRGLHWHFCHHLAAAPEAEASSPGMHSARHSENDRYAELTPKYSFIQNISSNSPDQADLVSKISRHYRK